MTIWISKGKRRVQEKKIFWNSYKYNIQTADKLFDSTHNICRLSKNPSSDINATLESTYSSVL